MKSIGLAACNSAALWTLALAAAVLSGLLIGVEPVGGDPDRMYRPIKAELAKNLAEGRIPYWSDNVGLGFPLVAESHAAAFYPPNQIFYRVLSVPVAYRLSMFLHYLMMAGATFAYGRRLGLTPYGAGLAAISFTFCGFQSIHSSHEWSYHALAYLPLVLLLADLVMAEGRWIWVAGLAAAYGMQLTVGHFQVQSWTGGLAAATALWRWLGSPRQIGRVGMVFLGLVWGAAIAAVQLSPSWELTRFVGFDERPFRELAFFGFPFAHWAELIAPCWLRGIPGGPEAGYWYSLGTTGYEACLYVGTIPLIFAVVGLFAKGDSATRFWTLVVAITFALAIMPTTWLTGYQWVASIPGMGLFRAPGRFLALTSLGLALLAGKGLDSASRRGRAWIGLGVAVGLAAVGAWWIVSWSMRPDHVRELGGDRLLIRLATAGGVWLVAAILAAVWIRGRLAPQILLIATALELGVLYYTSTTDWGWAVPVPESSPIMTRLAQEEGVGKVAGLLTDMPMRIGLAPLYPYTGFAAPAPHPRLEAFAQRKPPIGSRLDELRFFGATHGVWDGPIDPFNLVPNTFETILESPDEALDRLVHKDPGMPAHALWRLVRFKNPIPPARAARKARYGWSEGMGFANDPSVVTYAREDQSPPGREPTANVAEVDSWDGRTASVRHDGPFDLVVNRMFYPGWFYSIDGGPAEPVARAVFGIQAAHVPGAGTHQVTFSYQPTRVFPAVVVSGTSVVLALVVLGLGALRRSSPPENDSQGQQDDAQKHGLGGRGEGSGEALAG
ncbi:hypothetical protein [Paludisphaera rhizosphaerae]|uniref:hypothetical protein n=1 Tax=Paludisphaera rhizosphaerae TaxID=2711216 RepID=UPI0013EBD86E|nr:hypothetical protein [Paludisphaera rhizosphaerae]